MYATKLMGLVLRISIYFSIGLLLILIFVLIFVPPEEFGPDRFLGVSRDQIVEFTKYLIVTIATYFAAVTFIYSSVHYVSSNIEQIRDLDTEKLFQLRRQIERENDAEVKKVLEREAEKFEQRLNAVRRSSLWSEEGDLTDKWQEVLAVARERLSLEAERLQARSRANLQFGILTSSVGVVAVIFLLFIFPPKDIGSDATSALIAYVPRLTIVIIIKLMSTFFFRMYVSNESDIKQNKNEITNIELKIAAGLLAGNNIKIQGGVSAAWATEERNFVLKKGEKTAGEAWRTEVSDVRSALQSLISRERDPGETKAKP